MKQLQYLQPGQAFNSPVLDAHCRVSHWRAGVLLYCNRSRARVKMDDDTHENNWPPTLEVEPVRGPNWEGEPTMDQKHSALLAKYRYHTARLTVAQGTGDADKIERANLALTAVKNEAANLGLALTLAEEPALAPAAPTTRTTARVGQRVTTLAAVGAAKEEPEMAQTKSARSKATKVAEKERKAKLVSKKAAKAPKAKKAPSDKATNDCLCGCKTKVGGKFAPGHDARVKGMLLRIERGEESVDKLPAALSALVKFAGRAGSDSYKLVKAPVKFPGRDDIEHTAAA